MHTSGAVDALAPVVLDVGSGDMGLGGLYPKPNMAHFYKSPLYIYIFY